MDKLIPRISIQPISTKEGDSTEGDILDFKLDFNNKVYFFSLLEFENKKLKLIAKKEDFEFNKYESILELKKLKTEHKYFKMFDNFEEFQKDFIELCKSKNITISYCDLEKIELKIDLKLVSNNFFTIILNKKEINQKDQMKFLLQEKVEKGKKINNLTVKIQELENNLKLMGDKIASLEKDIKELKKKALEKEKEIREIKEYLYDSKNNIIKKKDDIDDFKTSQKLKKDDKEIVEEIVNKLEEEYYVSGLLDLEDLRKKIIEYKFNFEEIKSWVKSQL